MADKVQALQRQRVSDRLKIREVIREMVVTACADVIGTTVPSMIVDQHPRPRSHQRFGDTHPRQTLVQETVETEHRGRLFRSPRTQSQIESSTSNCAYLRQKQRPSGHLLPSQRVALAPNPLKID
jgi:hypothetical protein